MGTQPFPEIQAAQYERALMELSGSIGRLDDSDLRRDVVSDTLVGDLSGNFGVCYLLIRDGHVLPSDVVLDLGQLRGTGSRGPTDLVGTFHVLVKDIHGNLDEGGVRDPSSIVTGLDFSLLVRSDFVHGDLIGILVVLNGDLSRHSAHGRDFSPGQCINEMPLE